jgi:hypothetical protein
MLYKSAQLCREEQAIVEDALNNLCNMPDPSAEERKASDQELRKMLDELEQKRARK